MSEQHAQGQGLKEKREEKIREGEGREGKGAERKEKREGRGRKRRHRRPTGEGRLSQDIWKQVGSKEDSSLADTTIVPRGLLW